MSKYNQKGAIPLLIPIIIVSVIIGGIFLFSKKPNNTLKVDKPTQNSPTTATNSASTADWKTYKAEKYGYLVQYPQNWTVEDLSSNGDQLIRLKDNEKSAFVLIETIVGPSLEKEGELEKVFSYLEDKLKNNTHLKVNEFTKSTNKVNKDILSYIARGEETYDEKTVIFEERFQVGKNGKGIRMHRAYSSESKDINSAITAKIMLSFTATK